MDVAIDSEELTSIVNDIFGTMAGLELSNCRDIVAFHSGNGYVVSAVQIVGDWQGAVRLDIDMELARQACANLTGADKADLSLQDVRDVAGELANMVAGSVKAACAQSARLSLPTVAIGRDFEFSFSQGKIVQALSFSHLTGVVTVNVIQRQETD
jgi:CheY-specific phosphatase CheX